MLRAGVAAAEAGGGQAGGGPRGGEGGRAGGPLREGSPACLAARAAGRCGPVTCL